MNVNKIKAWATVDEDGTIVALCGSREEARDQKRYAAKHGWKQKIAKLTLDKIVR